MADFTTRRFKCICAYDGTDFAGWQSQPNSMGIQDFIEKRLEEIFKKKIRIHGSGRTDAGVHADNQVFHFDASWKHSTSALLAAMRCGLPNSLLIKKIVKVSDDFHARYSVKGKRYVYKMTLGIASPTLTRYRWSLGERPIDISKMIEASNVLLGTHDFTAFSANRGVPDGNPVKTITKLDIKKRGKEITVTVEGSGFLYKMVRLIVGALVDVGYGRLSAQDLKFALNSKKRTNLFQVAIAKGLTLSQVFYHS